MRIIKTLIITLVLAGICTAQQKFTFAIGDIVIDEKKVSDQIKMTTKKDVGIVDMLNFLEKYTTIKVDKEPVVVTFKKVEEIEKYPLIFMSADGPIDFSELECKNMAEYCKRGGFIFIDDCVYKSTNSLFFRSFKDLIEKKIFPGKKAKLLSFDHEIYHCHFDLPAGLPYMQGEAAGGWAVADDKGRIMIMLSPHDIHCGWLPGQEKFWSDLAKKQAFQFMTNLVIYSMTH